MTDLFWTTEKRKVKDLKIFEKNPRRILDKKLQDLKDSIENFGVVEIPAINIDNTVSAGNQRVRALMEMGKGDMEIDVRVPNRKLTPVEFEEYCLRSNLNTGEWDEELLSENFDHEFLEHVGFEEEFCNKLFNIEEPNQQEFDENIQTENECPSCGYKW